MTKRLFSVGVVALAVPAFVVPALAMPSCVVDTPVVEGEDAGSDDSMGGAGAEGGSSGAGAMTGGSTTGGASTGGEPNGGTGGASPTGGSGGFPPGCTPQQATGVGPCRVSFGTFFFGDSCAMVGGCDCEGEDCDAPYASEEACVQAHRGCITGCMPQDAAFTGLCEPAPRKVFTGVACVEMVGCACVGEDCESTYPMAFDLPDAESACENAHARCSETSRSCDEIAATLAEYASRDACEEDSDCRLSYGDCSIPGGRCYYFMNRQWPEEGLDALRAEYSAGNCGAGIACLCTEPPESVACVDGRCVGVDP